MIDMEQLEHLAQEFIRLRSVANPRSEVIRLGYAYYDGMLICTTGEYSKCCITKRYEYKTDDYVALDMLIHIRGYRHFAFSNGIDDPELLDCAVYCIDHNIDFAILIGEYIRCSLSDKILDAYIFRRFIMEQKDAYYNGR